MNKAVEVQKVNGLLGDPAVYAFFQKSGTAILFDLGDLAPLGTRELLKVRTVLVSHTHIDHFIGFDRLLRVNIPLGRVVELIGPPGLIGNVEGKLRGYLWNLLDAGQIRFVVHEVAVDGAVTSALIESDTRFHPVLVAPRTKTPGPIDPPLRAAPIACLDAGPDGARIEAVALDHKTPSIAYACQMPRRFHVREEALVELGVAPGPWIKALQIALGNHEEETELTVAGRTWTAGELGQRIFVSRAPRPLGYLTDLGFTQDNLARAVSLFQGTELLICETNYRDAEYGKARDRMHLTTRQAALIAAAAGVQTLEIFHISHIYVQDPGAVVAEAAGFFAEYRALSPEALAAAVAAELAR